MIFQNSGSCRCLAAFQENGLDYAQGDECRYERLQGRNGLLVRVYNLPLVPGGPAGYVIRGTADFNNQFEVVGGDPDDTLAEANKCLESEDEPEDDDLLPSAFTEVDPDEDDDAPTP